ncbi:zinc-dependent peptidase [Tenacibaculum sp. MEBiC06402]|uniref:zinc-dependent peptidase n=1 Tax=unclassified Tenacibaculum TaxID=2635139 RepID=UPI003B9C2CC9
MKSYFYLKVLTYGISGLTIGVNVLESIYIAVFNKPIFVHLYFIKKKLPKHKKEFLTNIDFYRKLNPKYQSYFEHRLTKFIRNYDFIERDGFELTPESKVLIASSYIKLTFGMRRYMSSTFDKIMVYPTSYYSTITDQYHKGEFNPGLKLVVFSWEDFLLGEVVMNDNLNLGIHEFTHALTFHGKKSKDKSAKIFYKVFLEIIKFMRNPKNSNAILKSNYFRDYANTNALEFLSVVMEHFFETPEDLKNNFPELYFKIEKMLNYKAILNQQLSE